MGHEWKCLGCKREFSTNPRTALRYCFPQASALDYVELICPFCRNGYVVFSIEISDEFLGRLERLTHFVTVETPSERVTAAFEARFHSSAADLLGELTIDRLPGWVGAPPKEVGSDER